MSVIDKEVYMNISQVISTIKSLTQSVKHEIFIDPVQDKPNVRKVNIVFRDLRTDDEWLIQFKAQLRKSFDKEKFPTIFLKTSKSNYSDKQYPRIVMTMNMNQGDVK